MALSTALSSSSPASTSQEEHDTSVLTPSRKVKALLAQFEDSDSEQSPLGRSAKAVSNKIDTIGPEPSNIEYKNGGPRAGNPDDQLSEDDVLSRRPRGHLAARMQTVTANDDSELSDKDSGAGAYARVKAQLAPMAKPKTTTFKANEDESSGDELQHNAPKKRSLHRKASPARDRLSRQGSRSPSPLFFPSPSIARSLARTPSIHEHQHDPDSEKSLKDQQKQSGSKFLALVEKHRKQRLDRERVEEAKRAERLEQLKKAGPGQSGRTITATISNLTDESDMSDGNTGKSLTKQIRPTRKASKKALEEMNRETQRMSRSMQLAHQAQTKKKITKESLLARFSYKVAGSDMVQQAETGHASCPSSSAPASDVEGAKEQNTPPTSPLQFQSDKQIAIETEKPIRATCDENEELPTVEDLLLPQPTRLDKGKAKAIEVDESNETALLPKKTTNEPHIRPIRVKWSKKDAVIARGADSDSDLEIVTSKSKHRKFAAFESLPENKSRETSSHLFLRSLAQLQTATKDDKHASMNTAQMEANLRRAARNQAQKEREARLAELRSRGIFIQSAEERQKEQQEVEDLVEQARVEGAEIQRRERETAKKDGTFLKDELADDESDDEEDADFQDGNEEVEDHLSGSEEDVEEESEEEDDDEDDDDAAKHNGVERSHEADFEAAKLIDPEAEDAGSEEDPEISHSEDEDDEHSEKENQPRRPSARGRRLLVLSDDEDDEGDAEHGLSPHNVKTPQSILRSARKIIPGLQMSDDLPIGLTQAFAATMADSQTQDDEVPTEEQVSLALTHNLPSPRFNAIPALNRLESLDIVTDSQPSTQTQPLDLSLSIMQAQAVLESPGGVTSTQFSFIPTQDVGYVMSPFKEDRFDTPLQAPHSTIETVILPQQEQSPTLQRKGRLRRGRANVDSDDEAEARQALPTGLGLNKSAFAVTQRAATSVDRQSVFDKTKSHAKEAVDEAAEESEDEYAGLGGASDDDEGEEDEADRRIIDQDETLGQGDESKLAGFYA
jgi:mediator of replication checkpoint protein 1